MLSPVVLCCLIFQLIFSYFLLSVWTERRNKKEPRTRSAVEQMGFPVSGCGTRGFAAHTVLARDDTEKPHLLPTAPAIVRPANTPPLVVADLRSGFDNDLLFFSDRFELAKLENKIKAIRLMIISLFAMIMMVVAIKCGFEFS